MARSAGRRLRPLIGLFGGAALAITLLGTPALADEADALDGAGDSSVSQDDESLGTEAVEPENDGEPSPAAEPVNEGESAPAEGTGNDDGQASVAASSEPEQSVVGGEQEAAAEPAAQREVEEQEAPQEPLNDEEPRIEAWAYIYPDIVVLDQDFKGSVTASFGAYANVQPVDEAELSYRVDCGDGITVEPSAGVQKSPWKLLITGASKRTAALTLQSLPPRIQVRRSVVSQKSRSPENLLKTVFR